MTFRKSIMIAPLAAGLMLAACGDDAPPPENNGNAEAASGEILERSISDEMIPLDRIESQAPAAESEEESEDSSE